MDSFAELAFELRQVARNADYVSKEGDELISVFPAGVYHGIEHAIADMRERARKIKAAADLLFGLSAHEDVVRSMLEQPDAPCLPGGDQSSISVHDQISRDFEALEAGPSPEDIPPPANANETGMVDTPHRRSLAG